MADGNILPWHRHLMSRLGQINRTVIALVIALAGFGFAMQYSAAGGAFSPWADKQMLRFAGSFILMLGIAITPLSFWMRYAYPLYMGAILLLAGVDIAGVIGMGARRWIQLGPFNLQPAELAKLAIVLALARYFHRYQPEHGLRRIGVLLLPLFLILLPVLLILRQPSLGSAAIVGMLGVTMYFLAGVRWRYFLFMIAVGLASIPIGWEMLHDYQQRRILTFLNPEADSLGSGYNIIQSMIAIGSGGFLGKGFVRGSQGQLDFLPEKQTDFIFTMLAEEFGFLGCMVVLLLFALLLIYGFAIAVRARSHFGSLLAGGVVMMLFIHMAINLAMVMGLMPVVGVPLPFISYGGSMLVTVMIGMGFLLCVYAHRDESVKSSGNFL